MKTEKQSNAAATWRALANLAKRFLDFNDLHAARLTAIEDRLAALDGGEDAVAAKLAAMMAANEKRLEQGSELTNFRKVGAGVIWEKRP